LENKRYIVAVPYVVFGELFRVLRNKELRIDINDLYENVKQGRLYVKAIERKFLGHLGNTIIELRRPQYGLESNDVLVGSLSLVDRECLGLLTFENKLIENQHLTKYIEQHRFKRRFVITDNPRRPVKA
jgi:hypothetical protein